MLKLKLRKIFFAMVKIIQNETEVNLYINNNNGIKTVSAPKKVIGDLKHHLISSPKHPLWIYQT